MVLKVPSSALCVQGFKVRPTNERGGLLKITNSPGKITRSGCAGVTPCKMPFELTKFQDVGLSDHTLELQQEMIKANQGHFPQHSDSLCTR